MERGEGLDSFLGLLARRRLPVNNPFRFASSSRLAYRNSLCSWCLAQLFGSTSWGAGECL